MSNLEDLKNRIKEYPISEIIGAYIQVKKQGYRYTALCPFHDDHNPSLTINNAKGFFKCFVDETHGDAISFVQQYKNLSFVESLKDICQKLGWRFEDYGRGIKRHPKFEAAEALLQRVQLFYRNKALQNPPPEYRDFVNTRGLSPETLGNFAVGLAPGGNVLVHHLQSIKDEKTRQETIALGLEIGLIGRGEGSEEYYDSFRERIVFPIHNPRGRAIGFCGRKTRSFQKAKYINSKESFIFRKRDILFGLHLAREEIRKSDSIILAEGHMDCIALHQYGLRNSVAIMGLGLGDRALSQIATLTQNLYLALDNDPAGLTATQKVNALCMARGLLPKFIDLSPHKDPDEFLLREGRIAFHRRTQEARVCLDYLIDGEIPEKAPKIVDRQIEILEKIFLLLSPLGKSLAAIERLGPIPKRLGMTSGPEQIAASYREFLGGQRPGHIPPVSPGEGEENRGKDDPEVPEDREREASLSKTEKALIQEIELAPGLLTMPKFSVLFDFLGEGAKDSISRLKKLYYEESADGLRNPRDEGKLERIRGDFLVRFKRDQLMATKKILKERQKKVTIPDEARVILKDLVAVDKELVSLTTKRQSTAQTASPIGG